MFGRLIKCYFFAPRYSIPQRHYYYYYYYNTIIPLPQWCAIQHTTEPVSSPGKEEGWRQERRPEKKCSKSPMHEDSSHGMNVSGKTYSLNVLKRLKTYIICRVSWTKERDGIREIELGELDCRKTSNLCVAWKGDDKR